MYRTSTHNLIPATPRTPRPSSATSPSATNVPAAAARKQDATDGPLVTVPNNAQPEGEPRPVDPNATNLSPGQGAHPLSVPQLDLSGLASAPAEQESVADEVRRAKDAQTQSKIELKQHEAAVKLDTRIAVFMKKMQDFVDKLEKKYKLRPGKLDALKNLFVQAEHQCLQRVHQGTRQVQAASATLEQHTREVQRLSALASGNQQNADIDTQVKTPVGTPRAVKTIDEELDALIKDFANSDQRVIEGALEVADNVNWRGMTPEQLRERFEREGLGEVPEAGMPVQTPYLGNQDLRHTVVKPDDALGSATGFQWRKPVDQTESDFKSGPTGGYRTRSNPSARPVPTQQIQSDDTSRDGNTDIAGKKNSAQPYDDDEKFFEDLLNELEGGLSPAPSDLGAPIESATTKVPKTDVQEDGAGHGDKKSGIAKAFGDEPVVSPEMEQGVDKPIATLSGWKK